jgi:hypothetical protein
VQTQADLGDTLKSMRAANGAIIVDVLIIEGHDGGNEERVGLHNARNLEARETTHRKPNAHV